MLCKSVSVELADGTVLKPVPVGQERRDGGARRSQSAAGNRAALAFTRYRFRST
jgi:hypothetical protein